MASKPSRIRDGETKVSGRTRYRASDLWLISQTLRMMVYAKFQYSLNALFCEPTEICEYKRKIKMYRVPDFCATLTFTNYGPLKRSADLLLTEFESHRRQNLSYHKLCSSACRISLSLNNMHILSDIF